MVAPIFAVLIVEFQVPVIAGVLVEVVGNNGATLFWHKVGICVNVGVLTGLISTVEVTGKEEHPKPVIETASIKFPTVKFPEPELTDTNLTV